MADTVLDELEFEHPDWVSAVDWSAAETVRTRRRLLDRACIDGSVVLAYHMAGIGNVESSSGVYTLTTATQGPRFSEAAGPA